MKVAILSIVVLSLASCKEKSFKPSRPDLNNIVGNNDTINRLSLLESKCYSCHSIYSNSHDEIIAPPMEAVKHRYLRSYSEKEGFIQAMSKWIIDPKQENALMRGAVAKFKVMPYLLIDEKEATIIATFIFENDLSKSSWFKEHQNQQHSSNKRRRGNRF